MSDRSVTAQHSTVQFLVTQCNDPFILCPILYVYTPLSLQEAAVKECCHDVTIRDALCTAVQIARESVSVVEQTERHLDSDVLGFGPRVGQDVVLV